MYSGSCYCKSVTYSINTETKPIALYCHCNSCRRSHSCSLYQVAYIPQENVTILSGQDNIKLPNIQETPAGANAVKRLFCSLCGSRVWNEVYLPKQSAESFGVQEGIFYGLFAGSLNSVPNEFTPTMHVWCSEAILDLNSINDSLPRHSHFPGMPENALM